MAGQPQGGGRTYSEEDVMVLMNEAAKRGANEAIKHRVQNDNNEEEHDESVINPKIVKQLKDTVAVFTALKELSSNPLQQTIEETVGTMAASVIQNAFAPRGPPPKRDLLDTILNSQFAFGLGSGIGQRGPELIESMGRTFGSDRAGQMIDGMLNKYGGPPSRQLGSGPGQSANTNPNPPQQQSSPPPEQKQSEKDLLLSLDPNNPEHVSAYAETQGGLPIEVARKMLMIHQDAFIEQMKKEGQNIDHISTVRGSRSEPAPAPKQAPAPPRNPEHIIPEPVSEPIFTKHEVGIQEPTIITDSTSPTNSSPELVQNDMQYAEYQDINQPDIKTQDIVQENQKMMKEFATDIGKIIGETLNKIENLNNTVFALQSELNDVKKQRLAQEQQILEQQISASMPPTGIKSFTPIDNQMSLYDINANLQNTDDFINELKNPSIDKELDKDIDKDIKDNKVENKITTDVEEDIDQIVENQSELDNNILNTDKEKNKEKNKEKDKEKDREKDQEKEFAHPITKNNTKKMAPSFKKDENKVLDENKDINIINEDHIKDKEIDNDGNENQDNENQDNENQDNENQ